MDDRGRLRAASCPLHRRYEAARGLTVGTGVKRLDPPEGRKLGES